MRRYLRVDANVETHQLPELRVGEPELISIVGSVVKSWVTVRNCSVITILISEDNRSDTRHFSTEINCIFKSRLPQFGLVDTISVSLQEMASGLAS